MNYQCCICKFGIADGDTAPHLLDPCGLVLISNIDRPAQEQKEQEFYCHFACFRALLANDGVLYIADVDFPTRGEVRAAEGDDQDDDR